MYIAHIRKKEGEFSDENQSVWEHCANTARLAQNNCALPWLRTTSYLAGLLHDAGKNTDEFLEYIKKAFKNPNSVRHTKITHSTAGGVIITQLCGENDDAYKSFAAELIREAIFSHHGLCDCISPKSGAVKYYERLSEEKNTESIKKEVYSKISEKEICAKLGKSAGELTEIMKKINNLVRQQEKKYGGKDFYIGMCQRMLMSLLIDADRTDTACFMDKRELPQCKTDKELKNMWQVFLKTYNRKMDELGTKNEIDKYRREISDLCYKASVKEESLCRLVVPTGGGKTLSGLRYALNHAENFSKRRIIYIAPYNSILEQNADVIREYTGGADSVLEHHCNVVFDTDDDKENAEKINKYKIMFENWNSPIVLTTAVQFLNTLFSGKTSSVRRMASLADAVIIFDEIQALPVRCVSIFNLAINFLTQFCGSSAVLCSATQPLLDSFEKNCLLKPANIICDEEKYYKAFKRTKIIDKTDVSPQGMDIDEMSNFTLETSGGESVLVILNTKKCAKELYKNLEEKISVLSDKNDYLIYHLSANMCPKNRTDVLYEIRKNLKDKKRVICISTQLIEAGVDISFKKVIRSMAGLDNVVQAAGRCNRNGECENGTVYIVKLHKNIENVSGLVDIKAAQKAAEKVLYAHKKYPEKTDGDLLSKKAMDLYYKNYFQQRKNDINYNIKELDTNMVDLLSKNENGAYRMNPKKNLILKQAFKTAGDYFEAIENKNAVVVIVQYDDESKHLLNDINSDMDIADKMKIIKRLQKYSVNLSESDLKKVENGTYYLEQIGVRVLREEYYNEKTGVDFEKGEMPAEIY